MKLIPYGKQHIDKEDIAAVADVLASDWITQGPKINEFEEKLAAYCGSKYAVAVSSGTAALHVACIAAGLKTGDEAITSPITFLATANSVLYTGARPVFADTSRELPNITPTEIRKKITARTKVILPVHFAGFPCDMEGIAKLARKKRISIIEDACHALGAEYKDSNKWINVGSCRHSDMTVFSFHPVKHITTGEGGAITTNSKGLYEKLKALRSHGVYKTPGIIRKKGPWYYEMRHLGFNYRITDFQCVLGISQLKKLDKFILKRREIVNLYKDVFENNDFFDTTEERDCSRSSWHLYPIKLKDKYKNKKEKIFTKLRKKGLGVQVHYVPVYWQPYYRDLGHKNGLCPNAEDFYRREISIPLYPSMKKVDIKRAVMIIDEVFNGL